MILRMSILLRQDLFLIQKNFVQLWLFEFYVPISFFIDFNERKNQNLRAIRGSKKIESNFRFEIDFSNRLPSKRRKGKTTPVRRAQGGGDNPKDRGVEEGKRISKLSERTFSDACALSLPALPLSQIAINR